MRIIYRSLMISTLLLSKVKAGEKDDIQKWFLNKDYVTINQVNNFLQKLGVKSKFKPNDLIGLAYWDIEVLDMKIYAKYDANVPDSFGNHPIVKADISSKIGEESINSIIY